MEYLASLLENTETLKELYKPLFFRLNSKTESEQLMALFQSKSILFVYDELNNQLQELIKCKNPSLKLKSEQYSEMIAKHLEGVDPNNYGVWVFYPWSNTLVHLLDEKEFIEVRTNRNKNKITNEEQALLATKKIGIVGLSVGQSIALTLAMERVCAELKLADFDTAELSNLNRIRTGTQNLGLKKTVIAAREIAEIDPFIKVEIFSEGLNDENIDNFFLSGGKLDLFVEVCDGIDIKIKSRIKAKQFNIPVVMDTNDRGMLDIERYDLESDRPILHGKLESFTIDNTISVTEENRMQIVRSILDFDQLSERLKYSMTEIGKSINTWPQLASSVVLGGAITADMARRILLKQHTLSGRYYVDLDEIFREITH